jgi:hypothetical protein
MASTYVKLHLRNIGVASFSKEKHPMQHETTNRNASGAPPGTTNGQRRRSEHRRPQKAQQIVGTPCADKPIQSHNLPRAIQPQARTHCKSKRLPRLESPEHGPLSNCMFVFETASITMFAVSKTNMPDERCRPRDLICELHNCGRAQHAASLNCSLIQVAAQMRFATALVSPCGERHPFQRRAVFPSMPLPKAASSAHRGRPAMPTHKVTCPETPTYRSRNTGHAAAKTNHRSTMDALKTSTFLD